ncbi:hypothetical protein COOONC_12931, partial [Cooperia oncophora]
PPAVSRGTPSAVEVREGHNVTLTCKAEGNPTPTVVWRRQDKQIIRYNGATGFGGEPSLSHSANRGDYGYVSDFISTCMLSSLPLERLMNGSKICGEREMTWKTLGIVWLRQ